MSTTLDAALNLAECGVPVFPCLASKRPACPRGFKDAVIGPDAAKALFRRYPGELIGVPTGAASRIDVLDLDMEDGADEWLADNSYRLPQTRIHHTRSGGYHWLFRANPDLRNSASRLGRGVDVRADGGYVIWWPATGLLMQNANALAVWPEWVIEELTARDMPIVPATLPQPVRSTRYVAAALERSCRSVAEAGKGTRNDALNRAAYGLARFVQTGELSGLEVAEHLAYAALQAGLDAKETAATIASALRARRAA